MLEFFNEVIIPIIKK